MQWLSRILTRRRNLSVVRYWEAGGPPYFAADPNKELRQGEIISNLKYYDIRADGDGNRSVFTVSTPFALVGSPDCDLLQEFRNPSDKIIGVLLYPLEEFERAKERTGGNSHQWRWVRTNQVAQFYDIGDIPAEYDANRQGAPELVADFKIFFTLPASEIYRQCQLPAPDGAQRLCRLNDVRREDFRQRALSYMGRVAVPGASDGA